MKVLFLSQDYIPNLSGVPIVVKYLAEGLAGLGHQVSVATSSFQECPKFETLNEVSIYRFNLQKTHYDTYTGDISAYVEFVLSFPCDVIIFECVTCVTTDVLLPYMDSIKAKKILHSHGLSGLLLKPFSLKNSMLSTLANTYHYLWAQYFFNITLPKYIRKFDAVCGLSAVDNTINYCKRFGVEAEILENAVDDMFLKNTGPLAFEEIRSLNKPYLLSVANYTHIKNQIGILKEFYKSGSDCAMVFIGMQENAYYEDLLRAYRNLESEYGHRDVLFLTGVPRISIPNIVEHAKLYLVGSTWEMYSISIIEAMTKGIPFISTNVGNAYILPGGLTVNNIEDMCHAIQKLTEDGSKYGELSKLGKEYALNNCKRQIVVSKLESLIKSVI